MRRIVRVIGPLAASLFLLGFTPPSAPQAPERVEQILFRFTGDGLSRAIQDSKWGAIGLLQEALNAEGAACGVGPVTRDGALGRATLDAVQAVAACRGAAVVDPDAITTTTFLAVAGVEPPDAFERARMLTHTMEGTDYDSVEWNVCAEWRGDAGSVMTWGPNGKTLGWGGELLKVLRAVDRSLLETAFAKEGAKGLDRLLALDPAPLTAQNRHRYPGARALAAEICRTPGQKDAWTRAFARLGADPAVRAAYDAQAWGEEAWFRLVVDRLADTWRAYGLEPTEVDFAFFLDRAIHMGWGAPRFAAVDRALAEAKARAGTGRFTNAHARFAVADGVRPTARPEDRLARDAIFLIDAEGDLATAMAASKTWPRAWKTAWRVRANVRASDVGLSDERLAPEWRRDQGGGDTSKLLFDR